MLATVRGLRSNRNKRYFRLSRGPLHPPSANQSGRYDGQPTDRYRRPSTSVAYVTTRRTPFSHCVSFVLHCSRPRLRSPALSRRKRSSLLLKVLPVRSTKRKYCTTGAKVGYASASRFELELLVLENPNRTVNNGTETRVRHYQLSPIARRLFSGQFGILILSFLETVRWRFRFDYS